MWLNTIAFLFVLGMLVLVHEFGHFIVAKWRKVRVEVFSLGFGRKLFSFRRGDTEYCISLIPLGGYVKLAGENPEEGRQGQSWEFLSKSVGERMAIVLAGPLFNYVGGFLLFAVVFWCGMPMLSATVGGFATVPKSDVVALFDDATISWERFFTAADTDILLFRDNAPELIAQASLSAAQRRQLDAWAFSPAQQAGIHVGDRIVSIAGTDVRSWDDLTAALRSKTTAAPLPVRVRRDGRLVDMTVSPRVESVHTLLGDEVKTARIGVVAADTVEMVRYTGISALTRAAGHIWDITCLTYGALYKMVIGKLSARKQLMGPVGIFKFTGEMARMGIVPLLNFMALLSVSLALINLFPLPVLDGGHLLFLIMEKIRGRPISVKAQEAAMKVGISVLLVLGVFVFYNDLVRVGFFERVMQLWPR